MCLRYFGSKAWLKKRLDELIPSDISVLVSPFLGNGKAEYYLLKQRPDLTLLGSDSFDSLVNYHQRVQDGSIIAPLREYYIDRLVSKSEHSELLKQLSNPTISLAFRAAFFFIVQHFSFNGKFGAYACQLPLTEKRLISIDFAIESEGFCAPKRRDSSHSGSTKWFHNLRRSALFDG